MPACLEFNFKLAIKACLRA
uniref:Uncharacterized protein n=1 Tax=Rhizophora mucronata TaxID=61149 RepID=A0A2P2LJ03_RHIMU